MEEKYRKLYEELFISEEEKVEPLKPVSYAQYIKNPAIVYNPKLDPDNPGKNKLANNSTVNANWHNTVITKLNNRIKYLEHLIIVLVEEKENNVCNVKEIEDELEATTDCLSHSQERNRKLERDVIGLQQIIDKMLEHQTNLKEVNADDIKYGDK